MEMLNSDPAIHPQARGGLHDLMQLDESRKDMAVRAVADMRDHSLSVKCIHLFDDR